MKACHMRLDTDLGGLLNGTDFEAALELTV